MPSQVTEVIAQLQLTPHPEGGWYRETWRAAPSDSDRGVGTSILFLLEAGQRSHWHRVDAYELWIFQAGTPLQLSTAEAGRVTSVRLGSDVLAGDQPQHVILPHQWQAAQAGEGWCLVACVVMPAFQFEGFELAPVGWTPERID
jgi:predicted cupin superfamily sugar epimerase